MKSSTQVLRPTHAATLAALLVLALAGPAAAVATPTDAWITTKVKLALATTEGVSATNVNVDTVNRLVTLHGTVRTGAERRTAQATAELVKGATKVRNLLQVVPAENETAVDEKDDLVQTRVAAALAAEPSLQNSGISVQSVHKGVLLLHGTAASLGELLTAVVIAGEVKGVRRVASEVKTEGAPVAEGNPWKERNIAVGGQPVVSARSASTDLYTTSMVKMRLLANAETPALDINVDTRGGVVTLFGIVPTDASKAAAEAEAGKAGTVTSVKNQLEVVPSEQQQVVTAMDDVVLKDLRKNLLQSPSLGKVDGEVKNCVVRLTGSVASGVERVEAMQIARATAGVCSVNSEMTIE